DQDAGVDELVEFSLQKATAVFELSGRGAVVGWGAARRIREIGAAQAQAVAAFAALGLGGEAGAVERGEKKVAAAVAGEHSSGAVGAVGGGGKADQDHRGLRIAETGHRAGPIDLPREGGALALGNLVAVFAQAAAALACGDFGVEDAEFDRGFLRTLRHQRPSRKRVRVSALSARFSARTTSP